MVPNSSSSYEYYDYYYYDYYYSNYCHIMSYYYIYIYNIEPHEAVPEVSRSKVHITQNKHVPIEWFVTTASQSRI